MKTIELIQKQYVGTHELRKNLTKLLAKINKEHGEVIVTHQGKPAAVLVDLEYYEEIFDTIADLSEPGYLEELIKAQKEVEQGKGIPAEKIYKELGIKA